MNIEIDKNDILACHRIGPEKRGKCRPIIVRFTSRDLKSKVLSNKKHLKGDETYVKVFINEDLTSLRFKLLQYVKNMDSVKSVSTREGKILCYLRNGRKELVETPDALFKLGVHSVKYTDFGLPDVD